MCRPRVGQDDSARPELWFGRNKRCRDNAQTRKREKKKIQGRSNDAKMCSRANWLSPKGQRLERRT